MSNNNGKTIKIIGVVSGIIVMIASIIWAASAQNQKLETTSEDVKNNTQRITTVEKAVIEIKTNQVNMIKTLDKIDGKLDGR